MRTYAFIGSLLVLILPFSMIFINQETLGIETTTRITLGLVYYDSHTETPVGDIDNSDGFNLDWFDDNGRYASYFSTNNDDPTRFMGLIIIVLLILSMAFASTKPKENIAAILLIVSGLLLFLLRLRVLSDNNSSFYDKDEEFLVTRTYIEIPLGLILALIFGILDMKKKY